MKGQRWFYLLLGLAIGALIFGACQANGAVGSDLASTTYTRDLLKATNAANARDKLSLVTSNFAANANQFTTTGNQINFKDGGLLTNPVVNSGTLTGNGSGLTNLTRAGITNEGTLGTNGYALLSTPPFSLGRPDPDPPVGIESWYSGSGSYTLTPADFSNHVSQAYTAGLFKKGPQVYILDDFWQGGRTNGHIIPTNTWASILTNGAMAAHIHQYGGRIIIYTENVIKTSNDRVGSGGTNAVGTNALGQFTSTQSDYYDTDVADFISWGMDGLKFDPHAVTDGETMLWHVRKITDAWMRVTNRAPFMLVDFPVFDGNGNWNTAVSNVNFGKIFSAVNMFRPTVDVAFTGINNYWYGEQRFYEVAEKLNNWNDRGHQLYLEHAGGIGQGNKEYFEIAKVATAMRAMLNAPLFNFSWDINGDADRWLFLTNDLIHSIERQFPPAYRAQSNAAASVWVKRMNNGALAVTAYNTSTNVGALTNVTIYHTNLGFPASQPLAYFNCWSNRFEAVSNTSFTVSITNSSGETFMVWPTNTTFSAGQLEAATNAVVGGTLYATNIPVIKQLLSTRDLHFPFNGDCGWLFESFASGAFTLDSMRHAATSGSNFVFQVPPGATNLIATYYTAQESLCSWTNEWWQQTYDGGTRSFKTVYERPVTATYSETYVSNSIPLVASTNSCLKFTVYATGSNTAGNYYIMGPIHLLWQR